ncbi:hypothetical protein EC973_002810 [Apophysomyces ossiformis]|uniref:RRM domain-containing protein n=1 Tax=Apophysomyces ossiformis TaxID=679940 RepID=A0A8H7BU28_9FUNG|nr:hypothetical protein EC973_002810 [Apophysomyces ossiformis]
MSGKKKAQKMSLSDFLADQSTGSWADEMEDLPSAPSAKESSDHFRGSGHRGFDRDVDLDSLPRGPARNREGGRFESQDRGFASRERFPPRAPVDLPTEPPFTAHVANLSFDATEDDIASLFGSLNVTNIRILRDHEEKSKGFCFVEFGDVESLKQALELNGESFQRRSIRIKVAEPLKPRGDRPERQPDRTDVSSWRRADPVESAEARREYGNRERGGFRGRSDRGFSDRRGDSSWSGGAFSRRGDGFGRSEAPAERPRLQLQPRTVDSTKTDDYARSSKPNPFGAAKPVDTSEALKRVEEKRLGTQSKSEQDS